MCGARPSRYLASLPGYPHDLPNEIPRAPPAIKRLKRINFQPLEDKVATKLVPWMGKHVTMVGRSTLVKSVITSIAIYYVTVLNILVEVLLKIDSVRIAFLWAACDKVTGGKCKVNWKMVCKPNECGGLGILNLAKFTSALRMRWLWDDEPKPCVGLGNPCSASDKDLFAAATKFTIGNMKRALFWEASWINGSRPKDIAPLIFDLSKTKRCAVAKALEEDLWLSQINYQNGLSTNHLIQFTKLWEMVQKVHLDPNTTDSILWKFTNDDSYSSKTAYNMQFFGHTKSSMPSLVWKPWAPPKCKTFAWLIIQKRVWTEDRLERRGWQNCGICKLCNQVQESASHMLFKCRFTIQILDKVKHWPGLQDVDPHSWHARRNAKDWWMEEVHKNGPSKRAMPSLGMLISWEI
jgi:hypothetical protein